VLKDRYLEIYKQITTLTESIKQLESKMNDSRVHKDEEIPLRIANLETQLTKIGEYELKIEAFLQIAEDHLESKNILTVEAPSGYRVNLNRLRNWAMMIDPSSSNDPYAQRVYMTGHCDLMFLSKKKQEFTDRINQ